MFKALSWWATHKYGNIAGYIVSQSLSLDFVNCIKAMSCDFQPGTHIAQVMISFMKFYDLTFWNFKPHYDFDLTHSTRVFLLQNYQLLQNTTRIVEIKIIKLMIFIIIHNMHDFTTTTITTVLPWQRTRNSTILLYNVSSFPHNRWQFRRQSPLIYWH